MSSSVRSGNLRRSSRTATASSDKRPNYRDGDSDSEDEWVERLAPVARRGKTSTVAENIDDLGEDFIENNIFRALSSSDTAIAAIAADFIDDFANDKFNAIKNLVNFTLRSCGCVCQLAEHDVTNVEAADTTVAEIQAVFSNQPYHEYPLMLASSSRNPEWKHFKNNTLEFISQIIEIASEQGVLYENQEFLELIVSWLASMSTSNIRSLRYAATLFCLEIENTICKISVRLSESVHNYQNQLEHEKKKTSKDSSKSRSKNKSKSKVSLIENNISVYTKQKSFLDEYLKDIFTLIFDHRYRDTDPVIRQLCASSLSNWIDQYPEYFSGSTYIRYFGFLLTDPRSTVRSEVIKVLIKLFRKKDTVASLDQFASYFKSKLVDMAVYETDFVTRFNTLVLLNLIVGDGYLEEEETIRVAALIYLDSEDSIYQKSGSSSRTTYSPQMRLGREVAKFISSMIDEKYSEVTESVTAQIIAVENDIELDIRQMMKQSIMLKILQKSWEFYLKNYASSSGFKKNMKHNTIDKRSLGSQLVFSLPPVNKKAQELDFLVKYLLFDISSVSSLDDDLKEWIELGETEVSTLFYHLHGISSIFVQGKANPIFNILSRSLKTKNQSTSSRKVLNENLDEEREDEEQGEHENELEDDEINDVHAGSVDDAPYFTNKIINILPELFEKYRSVPRNLPIVLSLINSLISANAFTNAEHDAVLNRLVNGIVKSYRESPIVSVSKDNSEYYSSLLYLFSAFFRLVRDNYSSSTDVMIKMNELLLEFQREIESKTKRFDLKKAKQLGPTIQKLLNLSTGHKFMEALDNATNKICSSYGHLLDSLPSSLSISEVETIFTPIFQLFVDYSTVHLEAQLSALQSPDNVDDLQDFFESHTEYMSSIVDQLASTFKKDTSDYKLRYESVYCYCDIVSTSSAIYASIAEDTSLPDHITQFYTRKTRSPIPEENEGALQYLFFVKEFQLAERLGVSLEREVNEDVHYDTPSDDDNNEEEVEVWVLEKDLSVYVMKLMVLYKLGLISKSFNDRLSLNANVLGDFYFNIFKISITSATVFFSEEDVVLSALTEDPNKKKQTKYKAPAVSSKKPNKRKRASSSDEEDEEDEEDAEEVEEQEDDGEEEQVSSKSSKRRRELPVEPTTSQKRSRRSRRSNSTEANITVNSSGDDNDIREEEEEEEESLPVVKSRRSGNKRTRRVIETQTQDSV